VPKIERLAGKKFTKLKVIGYSHSKGYKRFWKCICECGGETNVCTANLKNGNTKSCGCLRITKNKLKTIGMVGRNFGNLMVIDRDFSKDGGCAFWTCLCRCGVYVSIRGIYLRNGITKSCGCKTQLLREESFKRKYGVKNPSLSYSICKKRTKSLNNTYTLRHWKTKEDVVCTASYEKRVVEYFNKNKIDFKWQIPFNMPNGKMYIIDAYVVDENKWIEIKGYKRLKNMLKWNWFHKEYPNSELWDEKVLKKMRVI